MSLDEYLGARGLSFLVSDYMLDKVRHPHGLTQRQRKKLEQDNKKYADNYAKRRNEAISEYGDLVERGEITPKTSLERTIETAKYGHPDNASTQAAIRILTKKGIAIKEEEI